VLPNARSSSIPPASSRSREGFFCDPTLATCRRTECELFHTTVIFSGVARDAPLCSAISLPGRGRGGGLVEEDFTFFLRRRGLAAPFLAEIDAAFDRGTVRARRARQRATLGKSSSSWPSGFEIKTQGQLIMSGDRVFANDEFVVCQSPLQTRQGSGCTHWHSADASRCARLERN